MTVAIEEAASQVKTDLVACLLLFPDSDLKLGSENKLDGIDIILRARLLDGYRPIDGAGVTFDITAEQLSEALAIATNDDKNSLADALVDKSFPTPFLRLMPREVYAVCLLAAKSAPNKQLNLEIALGPEGQKPENLHQVSLRALELIFVNGDATEPVPA